MAWARRRNVHVRDLQVGMRLLEHLRGRFGKILVCEGEVLTEKHVEQIRRWEDRPGEGRLSLYTRDVWVQPALGTGQQRPACDTDPYAAVSVQKYYRSHK